MENLSKLLIKLFTDECKGYKWIHLCYIPEELLTEYREKCPENLKDFNVTITRWCNEDFNSDVAVTTQSALDELKSLVRAKYQQEYPDIFLNQPTDRQGWLRVWITTKMKEDLERNGE